MHKLKVKRLFTAFKKLMIAEGDSDLLSPFRFKICINQQVLRVDC